MPHVITRGEPSPLSWYRCAKVKDVRAHNAEAQTLEASARESQMCNTFKPRA
jgi:hypothetical protein